MLSFSLVNFINDFYHSYHSEVQRIVLMGPFVLTLFLVSIFCKSSTVLAQLHVVSDQFKFDGNCSTDEINHSVLIECRVGECETVSQNLDSIWPSDTEEVIHMYSSRSGDRFAVKHLKSLNFQESDLERMLNINTTIYANTNSTHQRIYGFGTTLDTDKLVYSIGNLDKNYGSVLRDLYAKSHYGIYYTILRITVNQEHLVSRNMTRMLRELDLLISQFTVVKIKVVLGLQKLNETTEILEALSELTNLFSELSNLEFWAVNMNQDQVPGLIHDMMRQLLPKRVFGISDLEQVSNFIDTNISSKNNNSFDGLLLTSDHSPTYNVLRYIHSLDPLYNVLTVGRQKAKTPDYGDWQNAQNHATDILNNLKYGSNAFIEASSIVDVLGETSPHDGPIYNLHQKYDRHFRGPMFYASGHFSRHLIPGSKKLDLEVFTQPNMFSAHYFTFMTPMKHVVSVVLNDNEHLLPVRVAIDKRIRIHVMLKPKSFNTLIIKV